MQTQRVQITLAAPSQLASSDQWGLLRSGLISQFPLRNLHWKPATRTSIRTIQSLEVNLITLESVKEDTASQIPASLLDRPFLNVYMVVCEDNDSYKNTMKKQIKDWHGQVAQRKNQEWLIVLVTKSDARTNQTGLLKMRGTILDRIRADFNTDKKDRCVQLIWTSDFKNPTAWAETISKIKDGFIAAFDLAVSQREEDVKRSELQKTMPGWNFCTFFVLKESLASSFEGANLQEDALMQYEELEASFFQVLKDKTLWFGKFVEPATKDDSLPLLSTTKKPYRDLILANTISVFDLRVYLLARQCSMLGQMGRITEIARKVAIFVGAFGKRLRDFQTILPDFFVESWQYSSALSAIETCDDWARGYELNPASSASFNGAKGELVEIARNQLDKLGIRLGYLPNRPPFSACLTGRESIDHPDPSDVSNRRASRTITNSDILDFLTNKATFYDLYIRLTNRAIDLYVKAGRRKFALKLHGSLAALDIQRDRYPSASQTYTSLPAHYAPNRWSSLESYVLFQGIETHSQMQGDHDRQWIHAAMTFLKAYVADSGLELLVGVENKDAYIESLVEALMRAAAQLDADLPFQEHPIALLNPSIDSGRCAYNQDGYFLDVVVNNRLPCDLNIDEISLTLSGRETERLKFTSTGVHTPPGLSSVALFCPTPLAGSFLVDFAEVRFRHLLLQWSFNVRQKRRQSSLVSDNSLQKILKLPPDIQAVQVQIKQSRSVEVGGPSRLFVGLASGRNNLSRAFLRFSSPEVTLDTKQGVVETENTKITFSEEGVSIVDTSCDQVVHFFIPHSNTGGRDVVKVLVELEYVTENEPELVRKIRFTKIIPVAPALTVNVQDFFRGEKLLTKFTISTTTHQHVRISTVELRPSESDISRLKIVSHGGSQGAVMVMPAQPGNFLFQLELNGEVNDPLGLYITYRLLREEVEDLVSRRLQSLFPDSSDLQQRNLVHDKVIRALENDPSWVEMYEATGGVDVPGLELHGIDADLVPRVLETLREHSPAAANEGDWRLFKIPVDLSRLDILATTRLFVVANPFDKQPTKRHNTPTLYAGQPFTAIVSVNTSFYWSGTGKGDTKQYRMRFEVEEMIKDWLISGQKRGDFLAKNGTTHTVSITMMALRHGEINLPKILVSAFPPIENGTSAAPPSLESYQMHGAERLLILPRGGRTTYLLNVGREE